MQKHNIKLKIFFLTIIFCAVFGVTGNSQAADHYIRSDASGANNGNDWTDAWDDLPATLTRGDTYYIADGTYGSYTVDDAVSGSLVITIKKATESDHGTETGWNIVYGDGQAAFTPPFNIITSYVTFDGITGSGFTENSYGFKINLPDDCNANSFPFGAPPQGYSAVVMSNIKVSHISVVQCGSAYDFSQRAIYAYPATTSSNLEISNNYIKNSYVGIMILDWDNATISGNIIEDNWSSAAHHGNGFNGAGGNTNCTVSGNHFKNVDGTAAIAFHKLSGGNSNFNIFNNTIEGGESSLGIGSADSSNPDVINSFQVHHNTFLNTEFSRGAVYVANVPDPATNKSYAYNNLFYNIANPKLDNDDYTSDAIVHSHNAHYNSSGTYDDNEGGTAIDTTGNPFVDSVGEDYRLVAGTDAIDAGLSLAEPFNIDRAGITRPQGSAWDIGAYEYIENSVDTTAPSSPTNLSVL